MLIDVHSILRKWHAHLSAHISGLDFDMLGSGYAARQKVFDAHIKYCKDIPQDVSLLFKERWRVLLEAGISEMDCIKQQATLPIGMLSNTVPTFTGPSGSYSLGVTFSPMSEKNFKYKPW